MKYDIFKDDKDKAVARESLPALEQHPGWKFITRSIDANIAYLTDELKDTEFENLLEVKLRQRQITHLEQLKDLPQTIVESAQEELPEPEEEIY
jgi:hypothetical protein